jgi:hypothetical protein
MRTGASTRRRHGMVTNRGATAFLVHASGWRALVIFA